VEGTLRGGEDYRAVADEILRAIYALPGKRDREAP
jgi:hypothetical protein